MKRWHDELPFAPNDALTEQIFKEDTLFFDIETTGFSAAHTQLYLIGCAARKNGRLLIDQFFAESAEEEPYVLAAFLSTLQQFKTIITFNGHTFDLPYLRAKYQMQNISDPFRNLNSIDLYQTAKQLKRVLLLEHYNLKSLEQFLGICRDDLCSGGDLVSIYKEFLLHPTEEALLLLKQHNYEDVVHLPYLLPVFSYSKILGGSYSIDTVKGNEYENAEGTDCKELFISLKNEYTVPRRVSANNGLFFLFMQEEHTTIRIPLFEGELKYFLDDYKNYYYLPEEDTAIHKSVGSFLDRSERIPAAASNCYIKKNALFVPQKCELIKPYFSRTRKDRITYFELTEPFIESDDLMRSYIDHILASFAETKQALAASFACPMA